VVGENRSNASQPRLHQPITLGAQNGRYKAVTRKRRKD